MKKILLIIEDEETIRENLHDMLSMYDFDVHAAKNGLEGLHKALEITPDLIISDIKMPVMDGYDLLQKIKEMPALSHTPFIFISANAEADDIQRGVRMGADDYITKPFKADELLAIISAHLQKHTGEKI